MSNHDVVAVSSLLRSADHAAGHAIVSYIAAFAYCSGQCPVCDARVLRPVDDALFVPTCRREKLSHPCKVMLFDHEVRMGESIDFQAPMKWACAAGEASII